MQQIYKNFILRHFFEEVNGAYWFGPLRLCVRASVRPLRFVYGQERLEIGSWNLVRGISMKNERTQIFFSVGLFVAELCPFFDGIFTLPL